MGYFLERAQRDYIVFERSNVPGSFYVKYPRHRKLISINKRHTGKQNVEFNLRHDWNSLLSHDLDLRLTRYSKDMFPHADVLVKYLRDFQEKMNIKVQFNTEIRNVRQLVNTSVPDRVVSIMEDQNEQCYTCRTLVMANGIAVPKTINITGMELAEGYETVPIEPEPYEGKTVLVLGRGNSAFEFADGIFGSTNYIHMFGRSRMRLAWSTHYVGDLRAINNGLLDTYMLKSLDGLAEVDLEDCEFNQVGDKIVLYIDGYELPGSRYDKVVRALGFVYDHSIFNASAKSFWTHDRYTSKKYPSIKHNYESIRYKGIFFAGTAGHSLDFRKSAGGFIHGFRYTARVLHRLLEWRYEGIPWPHHTIPRTQLINSIVKRINEASGIYQMFQFLGDIVVFSEDQSQATYLEEYPIRLLSELTTHTGVQSRGPVLAIVLEYGQNFSGPGEDVFRDDRAVSEPYDGAISNFLHPVLYYYNKLPTESMMKSMGAKQFLPRPDGYHAIVEDFITEWTVEDAHILPLRRFLENMFKSDLRQFTADTCFLSGLTMTSHPETCALGYMAGRGIRLSSPKNSTEDGMVEKAE